MCLCVCKSGRQEEPLAGRGRCSFLYTGLAEIYDYLVAGVDFEAWIDYLEQILKKFNYQPATVADLACGTGNTLFPLARRGYQVTGIDISPPMVAVAGRKARAAGLAVTLLVQDMRTFRLDAPVELVTCFHDGLNYILEYAGLVQVFCSVRDNLTPGGMFVFDLNALTWLAAASPETGEWREEKLGLTWESKYDPGGPVWEICLRGWIEDESGRRDFTEIHRERGYSPAEVEGALTLAGLKPLAVYDAFTFAPVHEGSRRHFYVARRVV